MMPEPDEIQLCHIMSIKNPKTQTRKAGGVEEEGGSGGRGRDLHCHDEDRQVAGVSYAAALSGNAEFGGDDAVPSTSGVTTRGRGSVGPEQLRACIEDFGDGLNGKQASRNIARRGLPSKAKGGAKCTSNRAANVEKLYISDCSEESDDSTGKEQPPMKTYKDNVGDSQCQLRKRGRPITSGEYKDRAIEIERYNKALEHQLELKTQLDLFDPNVDPPDMSAKWRKMEADMVQRARELPTADMQAQIIEACKEVEKVAGTSGNLKGAYVQSLKKAAILFRTHSGEIGKRTVSTAPSAFLEKENAELRKTVEDLTAQVGRLAEVIADQGRKLEAMKAASKNPKTDGPKSTPRPSSPHPMEQVTAAMGEMAVDPVASQEDNRPQQDHDMTLRRRERKRRAMEPSPVMSEEEYVPFPDNTGSREEKLLQAVASIVEAKMNALREELRPSKAAAAPSREKIGEAKNQEATQPSSEGNTSSSSEKKKKKNKKKKRETPKPQEADVAAVKDNAQPAQISKTVSAPEGTWSTVVGRKVQRAARKAAAAPQPPPQKGEQKKK